MEMPSAIAISLSDWPCDASSRICTWRGVPPTMAIRAMDSAAATPPNQGCQRERGSGWGWDRGSELTPGLGLTWESELARGSELTRGLSSTAPARLRVRGAPEWCG